MRKFLSIILTAAMVIAMLPCVASATGTVISITAGPGYQDVNHTGMVVTPEINVVSGEMPAGYKYQWYAQDGNSTEYILPWETGASITINSQIPAGWYLNFEATPLDSSGNPIGNTVKSNHYISTYPLKGGEGYPSITSEQSAAYRNTPSEYTFEVDGVKFILLDRVWSGEYYVMMDESVGKRQFDTSGPTGKQFYATSETHLAHWLNSTESGNFLDGTYLPSSVQSHITEEAWTFEGDGAWGGNTRTLKVGLLSYSEYLAYFGRFGLWLSAYNSADPTGWEGWWLRTLYNNQKVFASFKNGGTTNGSGIMGKLNSVNANDSNYHVRPTFHLDADFFKDVRVSNYGSKVAEAIRDCVDDTEIEIEAGLGSGNGNRNSMVVTPTINYVRGPVPASYKYQWYVQNGNSTEYILPWETGASITINAQIPAGWYLNFEATPLDSSGNPIGDPVRSNHHINTYPMKGIDDSPAITAEQSTAWRDTPSEYLFEVDGVKFILLDRLYNGEYYVMMEECVGKRKFYASGNGDHPFDAADTNSIAYWLNSTASGSFLDGTNLPSSVQSHITEEAWTNEGSNTGESNFSKTYKVGLLSYSEFVRYLGRFGLWISEYDAGTSDGFWLRTIRAKQKGFGSARAGAHDGSTSVGILGGLERYDLTGSLSVRPTFHLDANFFRDVKVDPATMGDRVKEILIENYTRAQLESAGYTKNEISTIGSQVDSFAVYDSSNNSKANNANITAGSPVTAKATIIGNNLLSPVMFFAVYNATGLEGVQVLTKSSATTVDGVTTYQLTVASPEAGKTYKAFLWDDLDNYMRLESAITLNCPQN